MFIFKLALFETAQGRDKSSFMEKHCMNWQSFSIENTQNNVLYKTANAELSILQIF